MRYIKCCFILLLILFSSCNSTNPEKDSRTEIENILPNKTWFVSSNSNSENYIEWEMGELNTGGNFRWHTLPCGSKANRSNAMSYNILNGPKLMIEFTTEQNGPIEPQVVTTVYEVEFISIDKIVLSSKKENESVSYTTLRNSCSSL